MIGVTLAVAWIGLGVALAWRRRPAPIRARLADVAGVGPPHEQRRSVLLAAADRLAAGGGRLVRRLARRRDDPRADRRLGRALISGLATAAVAPAAGAVVGLAVWAGPTLAARRRSLAQATAVIGALPDVVDLFAVAIGSGLNIPLAIAVVAPRAPPPLREPLVAAAAAIGRGERVADALACVPDRAGDAVRPLVTALVTSLRYGDPLLPALERVAADVRLQRRRRAEEAARRVPVKLLFPLVLCILPAFALLSVAPVLVATLRDLRP